MEKRKPFAHVIIIYIVMWIITPSAIKVYSDDKFSEKDKNCLNVEVCNPSSVAKMVTRLSDLAIWEGPLVT